MALSDHIDHPISNRLSLWGAIPPLVYSDTGERYPGDPARIVYGEPVQYFAADGRTLIPATAYDRMKRWKTYIIPLETVKSYLKVEHNTDDSVIHTLSGAAISAVSVYLQRDFETVPADVELAILKTILFWYENRGDENKIPESALSLLVPYRRFPGT